MCETKKYPKTTYYPLNQKENRINSVYNCQMRKESRNGKINQYGTCKDSKSCNPFGRIFKRNVYSTL